ncbi:MAG TPA: potassium-transporting ATPase subunit KdpC [Acidobacteriaceae bacterium]|jgi:K+-transporting ATPase ATPase C chain|nr:potassium-transporting ATPase subunit KdpC [Acidobacteriaceae bacterium]
MKSVLIIAIRYTIVTTLLLGVGYPLLVMGLAQLTMRRQADGQLVMRNGQVIGSAIIGQSFSSDRYFHGRPSAAGSGYDATSSGGSNYGPTNKKLIDRIDADVAALQKQNPGKEVPIGLVTTSASGLDPDISPAGALYQVPRVAAARHLPESAVRTLVERHIEGRQFGFMGEPRVNVLRLNLDLDRVSGEESTVKTMQH